MLTALAKKNLKVPKKHFFSKRETGEGLEVDWPLLLKKGTKLRFFGKILQLFEINTSKRPDIVIGETISMKS